MLKIIEQRWALIEVVIVDTLVQGSEAASQIANALHYADSLGVDVVVVGRGGGSAEDLWSFNEEMVADVIFSMQTPVVSAVGHEVDVMISDFVADLRAPTPSAAMEMILPDMREILYTLNELSERFTYAMNQKLQHLIRELKHTEEILLRSSPSRQLKETQVEFTRLEEEFKRVLMYKLERYSSSLPEMVKKYRQNMIFILEQKSQYLEYISKKLTMNDPKLQCRKGWAQISVEDKTVTLSEIEVDQTFVVQDAETRIEAVCLSKT
jgi:exodeoxyribonuclease VII large subunit